MITLCEVKGENVDRWKLTSLPLRFGFYLNLFHYNLITNAHYLREKLPWSTSYLYLKETFQTKMALAKSVADPFKHGVVKQTFGIAYKTNLPQKITFYPYKRIGL